jgi:hypothetical protein
VREGSYEMSGKSLSSLSASRRCGSSDLGGPERRGEKCGKRRPSRRRRACRGIVVGRRRDRPRVPVRWVHPSRRGLARTAVPEEAAEEERSQSRCLTWVPPQHESRTPRHTDGGDIRAADVLVSLAPSLPPNETD